MSAENNHQILPTVPVARVDSIMADHLRVYNLRASHSSAVIATSEHCSATIRGRQDLIDQCSLVGDCIRGILLIQELGIVEMIGGLAGIDITGFQILAY